MSEPLCRRPAGLVEHAQHAQTKRRRPRTRGRPLAGRAEILAAPSAAKRKAHGGREAAPCLPSPRRVSVWWTLLACVFADHFDTFEERSGVCYGAKWSLLQSKVESGRMSLFDAVAPPIASAACMCVRTSTLRDGIGACTSGGGGEGGKEAREASVHVKLALRPGSKGGARGARARQVSITSAGSTRRGRKGGAHLRLHIRCLLKRSSIEKELG